jgi:osmotically-inducible protein OsmY
MRKLLTSAGLVATGAGLAYLYDPDRGRARRARLRDQGRARLRERSDAAERQARYAAGVAAGAEAQARGAGTYHPHGDVDLREHLHQVLAECPIDARDVNVDVVDGIATLRGQVQRPDEVKALQAVVADVPGVLVVQSWLHLPGTPAPNKAEAINAA